MSYWTADVIKALAPLVHVATECLTALANESKLRAGLILAEIEEAGIKIDQAKQESAKDKGATGMMAAPFGYCALCGEPNISRNGTGPHNIAHDMCPSGHFCLSSESLLRPPKPDPPPTEVIRSDQTHVPEQGG